MAGVQDLPENQQRAAVLKGIPEEIRGLAYFYPGFANSIEACKYLEPRAADAGYFLLRLSSKGNDFLALSISVKRMSVRHMTVNMERTPYLRYFINEQIKFDTFEDLRKHYSEYSIRNSENIPNIRLLVPLHRGYRDIEEYMRLNPNFRYSNGIPIPGTRPDDDIVVPWTPEEGFLDARIVELRRKRESVYANRPLPKPPNEGRRSRPVQRSSTMTRRSIDRPMVEQKRHSTNTSTTSDRPMADQKRHSTNKSTSMPRDMSLLRNINKRSNFLEQVSSRQDEPEDKKRTLQETGVGARPKSTIVLKATNPFSFLRKFRSKSPAKLDASLPSTVEAKSVISTSLPSTVEAKSAISMDLNSAATGEVDFPTSGDAKKNDVATASTNSAAKLSSKADEMITTNMDATSSKRNIMSPTAEVTLCTLKKDTRRTMILDTKTLTKVVEMPGNKRDKESPGEDDKKHETVTQLQNSEDSESEDEIFEIEDVVTVMSPCKLPNEEEESNKTERAEAPASEPQAPLQQPEDDKSGSTNTKDSTDDVLATTSPSASTQIRRLSTSKIDDYTRPTRSKQRYSLRPPCPTPAKTETNDTYYSRPVNESENKIDELKRALQDQEYCDCGILMGASFLPRNWTLHRSLNVETYKWLFYQNDQGVTTWDLPKEIVPEITKHQFNVIAKLSADCDLPPPEELSCRFPEGFGSVQVYRRESPSPLASMPTPVVEVVTKKKKSHSSFSLLRGLSLSVK